MAPSKQTVLNIYGRTKLIVAEDTNGLDFGVICDTFGVSLLRLPIDTIDVSDPELLAVVAFVDNGGLARMQAQLVKLVARNIFEYGVFLIVASYDGATGITARANTIAAMALRSSPRKLASDLEDFAAIGPSQPARARGISDEQQILDAIALTLRSFDVEPAVDSNLVVEIDKTGKHWEQDKILVQRAFNGFTKVTLREQSGGRSQDCFVWRIEAEKGARHFEPFIAKAAVREDLVYEFNTYREMVRDHVPFPFRAPVLESKFVKGGCRALLVSSFVTRAQRLDQYLIQTTNPELPIASLFHNALAGWRRATDERRQISIGAVYVAQQKQHEEMRTQSPDKRITGGGPLLPNPIDLEVAYQGCHSRRWKAKPPADLWNDLESLPQRDFHRSNVHGDLNIRNVFVRWNTTDTILIDFSNSGSPDFLARDPAKLETSIALTCRDCTRRPLSLNVLRKLYRAPLLPLRTQFPTDGRIEAIRQVRKQAGGEGITNHEYGVVVASHLLRFASVAPGAFVDADMAVRRALAYSLACRLIENCK